MQTIPSISPKPAVVTFYGVRYNLQKLSDITFNQLYDALLDDVNDYRIKSENWTADEWKIMQADYERKQAQNGYNLELLEVEERRRKVMATGNGQSAA